MNARPVAFLKAVARCNHDETLLPRNRAAVRNDNLKQLFRAAPPAPLTHAT